MAATADVISDEKGLDDALEDEVAVATNATVYLGALVNYNTGGRVVDATAVASRTFAGVAIAVINDSGSPLSAITGNSAGTIKVRIRWNHLVKLAVKTSARTWTNLTKTAFVSDNITVDGTAAGTTLARVAIGPIDSFDSTKANAYVRLTRALGAAAATG